MSIRSVQSSRLGPVFTGVHTDADRIAALLWKVCPPRDVESMLWHNCCGGVLTELLPCCGKSVQHKIWKVCGCIIAVVFPDRIASFAGGKSVLHKKWKVCFCIIATVEHRIAAALYGHDAESL